jgi:exodeoxyribonuclease-3
VWSHKALIKVVSHTPIEVEALERLQRSNSWVDLGRHFHPAPARLHTWWSYRSPDWTKNDRGRRLDHQWATADVAKTATAHTVFEDCRSWLQPSDHVPIMTEFSW